MLKNVNLQRILQEFHDFQKENNHQLDDIKDELNKTNQRIGEAEDRIGNQIANNGASNEKHA